MAAARLVICGLDGLRIVCFSRGFPGSGADIISALTVLMSAGIAPGVAKAAASGGPLFLGFQTIFCEALTTGTLALLAFTGLIASFHAIIFAYGRQIYSLSRAGYFPMWLSVTHGKRKTPHRALIAGPVLGYAVAQTIHSAQHGSPVGPALLNMAGALVAVAVAMAALATLFRSADHNQGVLGAPAWFVLGIAYDALYARKRLVLSPEEQSAFVHRREGPPA
jgi:ethanolamine permease